MIRSARRRTPAPKTRRSCTSSTGWTPRGPVRRSSESGSDPVLIQALNVNELRNDKDSDFSENSRRTETHMSAEYRDMQANGLGKV